MPSAPQTSLPLNILAKVVEAVTEVGRLVASEFALPDGPRFSDHVTAPLDTEIELLLRDRLLALMPARFVGEEAGVLEAPANGYCWVVDPHDGTRAFLEGRRGSAVSVALLRYGTPVLAVVYAPTSPDRGPDLISWAEGGPIAIVKDGDILEIDIPNRKLTVEIDNAEMERRMTSLKLPPGKIRRGYLARYAKNVTSANRGAVVE